MNKQLNSVSMEQKAIDDFMIYSTAVIKSRAIPLVEDGLKPVARRILFTMNKMKLTPTAKTVKSANVVGSCMLLHPHGDASIYDAMVRLSQDWKMRYPLVYIQGNNGSLNGDTAAHMRYTECRLSAAGAAMLEGLDPDILKFVPNYDNSTTEPTMLSGIFPNVLCNGTEGIAVGLSSSLVPHNLNNVCDLIEGFIKNPSLNMNEVMDLIKGPDFPLGGIIVDGYKLPEIYSKGQGSITLRAKAEIDEKKNAIIISEFPYLVDVQTRIVKSIKDLVLDKGYTDIVDVENHIGKASCYITVVCQKGANLTKVLNDLYEQTPIQKTIKINNTVIHNGVPVTMPLLQLVNVYLIHRHSCISKIAQKELSKQNHIIHIQQGLKLATASIDEVVRIIRNSDSKEEAKRSIIKLLGIDSEQTDAILALQLGRLTRLDVNDIEIKIRDAEKERKIQLEIIARKDKREEMIIKDLERIRKMFGDQRRTVIVAEMETKAEEKDEAKAVLGYVVLGKDGQTYNISKSDFATQFKKGGKYAKLEIAECRYNEGKQVLVLNDDGTTGDYRSTKTASLFVVNKSKQYIITVSVNGIMKKTSMKEYKKFDKLCKCKEGDQIVKALCVDDTDSIMIFLPDRINSVKVSDIKATGKLTIGTKQSVKPILNCWVATEYFYTINKDNQVKRTLSSEIKSCVKLNDNCVWCGECDQNNLVMYSGKMVQVKWDTVTIHSKDSNGAKLSTKNFEA